MKKKIDNKERIIGRLYEHSLVLKTVERDGPNKGKQYITGIVSIATDDDIMNIVDVHYTYVAPTFPSGKQNSSFPILQNIMTNSKTVLMDGKDNAMLIQADPSLGLNEFYSTRSGQEELVSVKRNEGGFVSIPKMLPKDEKSRTKFDFDMFMVGSKLVEADEEKGIEKDYLIVRGYIFDFRNAILPMEVVVRSDGGIKYFEGLELSQKNPIFTKVTGNLTSRVETTKIEKASAFGEPEIEERTRTVKEWVVTWAQENPYELGDAENGITSEDIKKALADRELYLADVKKRQEEYQASRNKGATLTAAEGGFDF